jgi:hypothetical protein
MDQATILLIVLVIVFLAVGAFYYVAGTSSSGPIASPPNPKAQFGVIKQRSRPASPSPSSRTSPPRTGTPPSPNPTPPPAGGSSSTTDDRAKYISISRAGASATDVNKEYIRISYSSGASKPIIISDWSIGNKRGERYTLGRATVLASNTSVPNQNNIILEPGGSINIITGRSPIGESFKANKCISYYNQSYSFTPGLPGSCPAPKNEPGQEGLSDTCYKYVSGLGSCRMPTSIPLNIDNQCREYINKYANYNGCITSHKNDADFYKKDWWIYLNRSAHIWSSERETIMLRDEKNTTIKTVTY